MRRKDITDMQSLAASKGGKCLSTEYVDAETRLSWMCAKGHTWDAPYFNVQRGLWCVQCNKLKVKDHYLEEVRKMAMDKGGMCLATVYENNSTPMPFRCADGHLWMARSNNIKTGHWCPTCAGRFKHVLSTFQEFARTKGGACISEEYRNIDTDMLWRCHKGHEWKATGYAVLHAGTWCPYCACRVKLTIEDMRRKAAEKGGLCLSDKYSYKEKLKWQCSKGHIWEAMSDKIYNRGHWCHVCSGYRKNNN